MKKRSKKEVEFLIENYLKSTYDELSSKLNRNKENIFDKLTREGLRKSEFMSKSEIMKQYYQINEHHTKGKHKSEEQKRKMAIARKMYLAKTDKEILEGVYKKMGETKRRFGVHSGEKNSMFGKRRPDLSRRNKKNWQ